jgi:hypothetical protein
MVHKLTDKLLYESGLCRPAFVKGKAHPDPIVETSSLASIRPPLPTYKHHLQACFASERELKTFTNITQRRQPTSVGHNSQQRLLAFSTSFCLESLGL